MSDFDIATAVALFLAVFMLKVWILEKYF